MKQRIYNGHSLEFFDSSNVKKGELLASGSFIVMPSGSDRGLVLGQVSGFARIGSTAGSLFLGGGSTGDIQVQSNLIPDGDSNRNLGATNRFFANVYADSITVGSTDTLVGDAGATGNSGLLLSSGQNVFITFDTNGTGADEFRVGHGSGNSALLSIKNATSKFANQLAVKTPTAFTANTLADELVIGSGVGSQGMTIYSGDSNQGAIFFADDLDEEGAGDGPAGNRDGVFAYSHNNSQFDLKTGGNQSALTVKHTTSEFHSALTVPNLTVTGDLSITGDINSFNVTDLDVTDKTISLGVGQTEANSGGSGIIIAGSSASLLWDESNNLFDFNKNVNIETGTIALGGDVSLFRDGANILRTDDAFHANGNIHVGADGKLFDRANTDNFIELANTINISTNTIVDGTLQVGTGGTIQPVLSRDSATGGLIVSSNNNSGDFIFKGSGGNEKFRIVDNGNVGINNSNPTSGRLVIREDSGYGIRTENASGYTFRVSGSGLAQFGGTVEIPDYITHVGDGDTKIGFNTDNSVEIRAGGNLQINADASRSYLRFQGTSKLYTDSDGVIISGTIKLASASNEIIKSDGSIRLNIDSNSDQTDRIFIVSHGSNSELFRVEEGGNVGINASSPTHRLTVNSGTTNVVGKFKSSDNQAWISVQDDDSGTFGALFGTDSDSGEEIVIANKSATKRFSIDSNGKTKLHAYGSGNRTGTAAYNIQVDSGGNLIETEAGGGGGGAVSAVTNGANDRVATFTSATALNGESGLTYSSTTGMLKVTSVGNPIAQLHGGAAEHGTLTFHSSSVVSATMGYHQQGYFFNSANGVNPHGAFFIRGDLGLDFGANNTGSLSIKSGSSADVIIDSKVKLGVGLSSPTSLLHVDAPDGKMVDTYTAYIRNQEATAGDNFGLGIQAGSNSSDVSLQVSDKAGNSLLRVRGDGNIGIGTTSPGRQLDLKGQAVIRLNADSTDPGLDFVHAGTQDMQLRYRVNTNKLAFYSYGTNSDVFTIQQSNGYVGINTTSPDRFLEIFNEQDGDFYGLKIAKLHSNTNQYTAEYANNQIKFSDNQNFMLFNGNNKVAAFHNGSITFHTNGGSERMRITSTGKVGIATNDPQATLSIGDNIGAFNGISIGASANRDIRIGQGSSNNLVIGWKYNATATSAYSIIENFGGNNPLYLQGSGGNVAIGTITPDDVGGTSKLTVEVGSGQGSFRLQNGSTDGVYFRRITTGGHYQLQTTLGNGNAGVLSLQSYAGKVGIGTLSPVRTFSVLTSEDSVARFESSDSTSKIEIKDVNTTAYVGANGGFAAFGPFSSVTDTGNIRIASGSEIANSNGYGAFGSTPTSNTKWKITSTIDTSADSSYNAQLIDLNVQGSTAVSADKQYRGLYIDLDSSATGGDTSDEVRLVGNYITVNDTGDADLIEGVSAVIQNQNSDASSQISNLRGLHGSAAAKNSAGTVNNLIGVSANANMGSVTGGDVTNVYGTYSTVSGGDTDKTPSSIYAGFFKVDAHSFESTYGTTRGVYGEIEIDGNATSTNLRAFEGIIDLNSGSHQDIYQLKLDTQIHANASQTGINYGIFSSNAKRHFIQGNTLLGSTNAGTPGAVLHIYSTGSGLTGIAIQNSTTSFDSNISSDGLSIGVNGNDAYFFSRESGDMYIAVNDNAANGITIKSGGNVGVGTTSPASKLHVYNTSTTSDGDGTATETASGQDSILLYGHGGTNGQTYGSITWMGGNRRRAMISAVAENTDTDFIGLAFYTQGTDGSGDFAESMRITRSGRVGIGTSSPGGELHIVGQTGGAGQLYISDRDNGTGTGDALLLTKSGTSSYLYNRDNGDLGFGTNDSNTMITIKNTGHVGIGTTAPNLFTEIRASQTFASNKDSASTGLLSLNNSNNAGGAGIIFCDNVGSSYNASQKGSITFYHSDSVSQGGGASFHIASTEPNLAVIAGSSSQNGRFLAKSGASNTLPDFSFFDDPNTGMSRNGADKLKLITGGTSSLHIDDNQRVGIGTSTMDTKLHISSSNFNDHITLARDANELGITVSGTQLLFEGGVSPFNNINEDLGRTDKHWNEIFVYSVRSGGALQFKTNGNNERMRIDTSGNVGIGTTAPQTRLHVVGPNSDGSAATLRVGGPSNGTGNNVSRLELVENTTNSNAAMSYGFSFTADGNSSNNLLIKNHNNNITGNTAIEIERGTGKVFILGDLQVNGTTTTVNSTNLDLSDNIIGLNRGASSNANDSGIIIERGSTGDNAAFLWDESADVFVLGLTTATPSATGNVALSDFRGLKTGPLTASGNITTTSNSHLVTSRKFAARDANGVMLTADDGLSGLSIADNGEASFSTNVSTAGQLTVGDSNADILQVGLKSVVTYGENTDIDTTTGDIKSLPIATYQAAFFDYVIKKGTNIRAGTVTAAHDGTNITFNEVSTIDLGDTTDVTLQVVKSGSNMVFQAVTLSNDWSVKAFVRAIKV